MNRLLIILLVFVASGILTVVNAPKQDLTNTGMTKMALSAQGFVNQMAPYANGNTSASAKFVADMYPYSQAAVATGDAIGGNNPGPAPSGGGGGYYGGGGGGVTYASAPAPVDPYAQYGGQTAYNQNIAQYDQGLANTQSAINRLPGQKASADSQVQASYDNALAQLLGGENQAHATYDTNKHQTSLDYVTGKNTVRANAGSSLNGLLRLLGSRGAGGGSAATITAPGAVARQATLQQGDLGNTFGQNNQSLDTNWNTYETGVNNERASARKQLDEQAASNNDQLASNQASLLQQLAQLSGQKAAYTGGNAAAAAQPYLNQANGLLNSVGTFHYSPINYNTQAYTAPNLAQYTTAPNAAPKFNGQTQGNDYTSPYLQALLGKKQQQPAVA